MTWKKVLGAILILPLAAVFVGALVTLLAALVHQFWATCGLLVGVGLLVLAAGKGIELLES